MNLAIIDFETSDLDKTKGAIAIEVGIILYNTDINSGGIIAQVSTLIPFNQYTQIKSGINSSTNSSSNQKTNTNSDNNSTNPNNSPTLSISKEIQILTGITQQALEIKYNANPCLELIQSLIDKADFIVSHNASFDKQFGEDIFNLNNTHSRLLSSTTPPLDSSSTTLSTLSTTSTSTTSYHSSSFNKDWLCSIEDFELSTIFGKKDLVSIALELDIPITSCHRALTDCQILSKIFDYYRKRNELNDLVNKAIQNYLSPKVIIRIINSHYSERFKIKKWRHPNKSNYRFYFNFEIKCWEAKFKLIDTIDISFPGEYEIIYLDVENKIENKIESKKKEVYIF